MKILLNSTRKPACSNANLRSLSRLPQVTEYSSNSRKKQRDYTIPVRLNQQFPSSPSPSSSLVGKLLEGQRDVKRREMMIMEDKQQGLKAILETNTRHIDFNRRKYQRNVKQQYHKRQQSSLIKMPLSFITTKTANNKTTTRVPIINQISIKITLMVIAITSLILLSSLSEFCHCDTYKINTNNNKNSNSKNDNALRNIQASIEAQHGALQGRNNANNRHQSDKSSAINSLNNNNNKENFLSYLTDNIERQHFKNPLKPVRAFVHQRPSKFDSGEDLNEMSSDISSNLVINRPKAFRNHTTNMRHSNIDKVDEGLRQIMMMHEHALPMTTSSSTSNQKLNQQQQQEGNLSKTNSMTNIAVKLREFSRGPARVASSLINPNKMMSNVLSYISPLVSSKLINSTSVTNPKLNFNPFVGRSNNQGEYSTATKNRFSSLTPFLSDSYLKPPSVTILPQTSFLAKPNNEKAGERQFSSTQASISLNDFSDTILKSALIKPNLSPKDLITSESSSSDLSFNHLTNSGSSSASTTTSGGNSINESSKKHSEDSGANSKLLLGPLITSYGSSWLRDNANRVAQNYIQDSFRGLLTLSQLPILQSGPISTAPSVFEKGGSRLKDSNKQPESSSSTNSQRTRAIDELYRYAYILGTGVRRKRDPLTALGSSSSGPNLAHSALSNRKGVFSQRSRNQFTANPVTTTTTPASNKQLLDYARNLKSILSTGAKPRGVMWDMATDPSLAVTVFHLLERASVALPLGFLLMPFVKMIHNPLSGVNLANMLPSRATHRSVDYEELVKRLDVMDKMLSRALRPTHRESFIGK